jgi:hypothetical protein
MRSAPDVSGINRSARRAAPYEIDDREQDDRPQERHDERPKAEIVLIDGSGAEQRRNEPSTQQGPDNPDDDVQEQSLFRTRFHHDAGKPSENTADNDPQDKVHLSPPVTDISFQGCDVSIGMERCIAQRDFITLLKMNPTAAAMPMAAIGFART